MTPGEWITLCVGAGGLAMTHFYAQKNAIRTMFHERIKRIEEVSDEHTLQIHSIDNRMTGIERVCAIRHEDATLPGLRRRADYQPDAAMLTDSGAKFLKDLREAAKKAGGSR